MSPFLKAVAGGIGQAMQVFGTTKTFIVSGRELTGDLDELGSQSYTIVLGGKEYLVTARLVCLAPQFGSSFPEAGTRLKMDGALYVIAGRKIDEVAASFDLADPDGQ